MKNKTLTGQLATDFPEIDLAVGARLAIAYASEEATRKGDDRVVGPILEASSALTRELVTSAEARYDRSVARGAFREGSDFYRLTDVSLIKDRILRAMMRDLALLLVKSGVSPFTVADLSAGTKPRR